MRRIAVLWLLVLPGLTGLRSEEGWETADWKTVRTEENRFVVNGLDSPGTQGVALWMEDTLRRLNREFGVRVAFEPLRPVVVVLHPDLENIRLFQQGRGRGLVQEIRAPEGEGFDSLRFAETFLEAMLYRFMDQQVAEGRPVPQVPGWLTRGWAPEFVPERRGALQAGGLSRWRTGQLNPPYSLTGPGALAGGASEDDLWAVAFLWAAVPDRERIWREILKSGGLSAAWWRQALDAGSVRDVHLAWEVWMAGRERRFLANPAAEALFREQLARELVLIPGRFGLDGEEVPREERFSLAELADTLDEHWVSYLLQAWRSRMSMLRFGQRAERLQIMDLYIQAVDTLLEARSLRGARREEALARFRRLYQAAEDL